MTLLSDRLSQPVASGGPPRQQGAWPKPDERPPLVPSVRSVTLSGRILQFLVVVITLASMVLAGLLLTDRSKISGRGEPPLDPTRVPGVDGATAAVILGMLLSIVVYGFWINRLNENLQSYGCPERRSLVGFVGVLIPLIGVIRLTSAPAHAFDYTDAPGSPGEGWGKAVVNTWWLAVLGGLIAYGFTPSDVETVDEALLANLLMTVWAVTWVIGGVLGLIGIDLLTARNAHSAATLRGAVHGPRSMNRDATTALPASPPMH